MQKISSFSLSDLTGKGSVFPTEISTSISSADITGYLLNLKRDDLKLCPQNFHVSAIDSQDVIANFIDELRVFLCGQYGESFIEKAIIDYSFDVIKDRKKRGELLSTPHIDFTNKNSSSPLPIGFGRVLLVGANEKAINEVGMSEVMTHVYSGSVYVDKDSPLNYREDRFPVVYRASQYAKEELVKMGIPCWLTGENVHRSPVCHLQLEGAKRVFLAINIRFPKDFYTYSSSGSERFLNI
jgi:hypothetical protein